MSKISATDAHRDLIAAAQAGTINVLTVPEKALELLLGAEPFARLWEAANSGRLTNVDIEEIAATFDTPLALFLLANFLIPYPAIEAILSYARRTILLRTLHSPERTPSGALRRFTFALAEQCFLNEYAYWEGADETMWVQVLAGNLEAMVDEADPQTDFAVAVLGCYRRLDHLPVDAVESPEPGFQELRAHLIEEPRREADIAQQLPSVTPITHGVSAAVGAHYEENPYPRWRFAPQPPTEAPALAISRLFPFADMAQYGAVRAPRMLIAGCGSGFQSAGLAKLFEDADILAIDLSRPSLAHAKRQSDALGLRADYAQGDLLALGANHQFDLIFCGGVLHHTADPQKSWAALRDCLRPGGLMEVALYNRHARSWLNAPRQFARGGGYATTAEDLRRFRRDLIRTALRPGALAADLLKALNRPDFYSLSMCRDAFFHAQEREYSLRELLRMAEELGLTFLGLKLPSKHARKSYVDRFREDPAVSHLACIEALERLQADFAGPMYTLLLQKPARTSIQ